MPLHVFQTLRPQTNCQKLPISSVTASGNDGHVPANVLDNNLNTRWSNRGIGSFIQADLGTQKIICSVDIAWYRGNVRENNFVISVSNDSSGFAPVGKSSGSTLSAERYDLTTSTTARFVRVTVYGNTENNWASITELSVDGLSNTPPQSNPPNADSKNISTNAGTPIPITLTGTDPIPGDTLKFSVVANPQHGTLTAPTTNSVTYTPNTGFSGTDSFTYKATTKNGQAGGVDSNIATVTITVNAAQSNQPPTADDKTIQTNAGTPIQITLTGTDPIPGDTLKFSVVANPQHGTLTAPTTNSVTYTPNTGFSGTDSFTYKATTKNGQAGGVDSNIATVTITVNAAQNNQPPTANNLNIQTNAGTPVQITLTGTDPIPGDTLKFSVVANPQHGTLTAPTTNSVTYTPNTGFSGTDSFTYKATTKNGQAGGVDSNIATVTITVNAAQNNQPPTVGDKTIQTNASTPVQITLTGTDPIPGDTLKFSVVANPQHGTLTAPTTNSVTYTPNTGFSGTDSFTYKATTKNGQAGGVDSNIATVTITVNAAQNNQPPTANNLNIQTNASTPVQITLTGTDPIPVDTLKFSVVANPQHGTLTAPTTNSVTYTPNTGFSGTDSFTYKATDGQGVNST